MIFTPTLITIYVLGASILVLAECGIFFVGVMVGVALKKKVQGSITLNDVDRWFEQFAEKKV